MKILHFSESFGGGVTTAILSYARSSNFEDHYFSGFIRQNDLTGDESKLPPEKTKFFPRTLKGILELYRHIETLNPEVIHLHSTFAGVIGRILPFPRDRIVYTPHGYSFLRRDGYGLRGFYYFVEYVLSFRTRFLAACSTDELARSRALFPNRKLVELVNISEIECQKVRPLELYSSINRPTIGMLGRVCQQKGVDFFLDVVGELGESYEFVWIGGGDATLVSRLSEAGVTVTGWLSRSAALERLSSIDLYLHCAAWDGFPISVLEAAHIGLPILLRKISPFDAENLTSYSSPHEVAEEIRSLFITPSTWKSASNAESIRNYHSAPRLADSIDQLYSKFLHN